MAWQGVEGHDAVVEQFRTALERGRLASTFLFVGPEGIGKRHFALQLAKALLCPTGRPMQPCGHCPSCRTAAAASHPDLLTVSKPADRTALPVGLLIGDGDRRNREGLCHDLSLRPMMARRRVAIVDDADDLNDEGANCLLKTLEEPPPSAVLILLSASADRQLPTIRSRCQLIRFKPLAPEVLAKVLLQLEWVSSPEEAARLAEHAEGSVSQARQLADPELWKFRDKLLDDLSRPALPAARLAKDYAGFIDSAGKEASVRRARFRRVVLFALEFYREAYRSAVGGTLTGDPLLKAAVSKAKALAESPPLLEALIDRCLETNRHIARFAHQTAALESWLDDLARMLLTGAPLPADVPR